MSKTYEGVVVLCDCLVFKERSLVSGVKFLNYEAGKDLRDHLVLSPLVLILFRRHKEGSHSTVMAEIGLEL